MPQQITPPRGYVLDGANTSEIRTPAGYMLDAAPRSNAPTPQPQTFGETYLNRLKDTGSALARPFLHPVENFRDMGYWSDPSKMGSLVTDFTEAPNLKTGAANALADATTFGLMAGAGEVAGRLPGATKSFIRGDVTAKIPGTNVTPLQRYLGAKDLGVQLDAADATNSPKLKAVKHLNENSLFGGPRYESLKGRNTNALQESATDLLDGMYSGDRESGGRVIQDGLRRNHANLRTGAENGFEQLSEQTQGNKINGAPGVGETATRLLNTIEPLASRYPSLAPNQTMRVLNDLSRVGSPPKPPTVGFLDAPGSEFAVSQRLPEPKPDTWSDLQRLRSATHDMTVANPDLVKSQALAPLQVMTSALDDAMTNASSGLTPEQNNLFRRSNAQWKEMKETYDDPSSPLYHAIRTPNPSTLYSGIGPKTPENAVGLGRRLSPFDLYTNQPSEALGALRRGTVEGALKDNAEGAQNFPRFGSRLRALPADYRANLFSPDQNVTLERIADTSNVLAKDFNPSGSGKLGQKVAEAAAIVPTFGAPILQYPIARAMTSPRVVDFLMRPSAPNPLFANLGLVVGSQAKKRVVLNPEVTPPRKNKR